MAVFILPLKMLPADADTHNIKPRSTDRPTTHTHTYTHTHTHTHRLASPSCPWRRWRCGFPPSPGPSPTRSPGRPLAGLPACSSSSSCSARWRPASSSPTGRGRWRRRGSARGGRSARARASASGPWRRWLLLLQLLLLLLLLALRRRECGRERDGARRAAFVNCSLYFFGLLDLCPFVGIF